MSFAPTNSLQCVTSRMGHLLVHGGMGLRGIVVPRLSSPRLIAESDEQSGNVFAVLAAFGKSWASAGALQAIGRQIDANRMGFRVTGANDSARAHFANVDVLDYAASKIFEPS
jgi:hypothetical protein